MGLVKRNHSMKKRYRQSSLDCVAKALRVFLICESVTMKTLTLKADISERTAARVVGCLMRENLIKRVPELESQNRHVFAWVGESA